MIEQPRGRVVAVDVGDGQPRVPLDHRGHPDHVPSLLPEVELAVQRGGQMLEDRAHVDHRPETGPVRDLLGEELEQREVLLDRLPGVGPLHLDDDLLAVRERSPGAPARSSRPRAGGVDPVEDVLPGTPSSCSITPTTCSSLSGGTLSCSVASSSMNSGGRRSGRVDSIWPSLQKVGPSSSSAARTRFACRCRPIVPSSSGRPKSSRSPCLAKTAAIFVPRAIRRGCVSVSTCELRSTVELCGFRTASRCRSPCSR